MGRIVSPLAGRHLALLLGLWAILPLAGCSGSDGEAQERAGTIAFTVSQSGFSEIWTMEADGRNRVRLTKPAPPQTDAIGNTSPAWSPDGRLIAYTGSGEAVDEDQDELEVYVMRADGSETRRLTNDHVHDGTPVWSPDGERLAFSHTPRLGSEEADGVIVVMNADGGDRIEITRHPLAPDIVFDFAPAWSPDGTLIAFGRSTYTAAGEAKVAIHTVAPDGSDERLLVEDGGDPAWSPDGTQIAFTSTRDRFGRTCFHDCSPSSEIYVSQSNGSDVRRLTKHPADDHSPTWSPDGRRIAFVSDRANKADHQNEIYVMESDGRKPRRLTTNDVWDLEPAWR